MNSVGDRSNVGLQQGKVGLRAHAHTEADEGTRGGGGRWVRRGEAWRGERCRLWRPLHRVVSPCHTLSFDLIRSRLLIEVIVVTVRFEKRGQRFK